MKAVYVLKILVNLRSYKKKSIYCIFNQRCITNKMKTLLTRVAHSATRLTSRGTLHINNS